MILARILELLLALFIVAEMIIPLWRKTPMFPLFRRPRQTQLLGDLEQAKQDLIEDDIEDQVDKLRAQHAKRHPTPVIPITTPRSPDPEPYEPHGAAWPNADDTPSEKPSTPITGEQDTTSESKE